MEQQKVTLEEVYRRLLVLENAFQIRKLTEISSQKDTLRSREENDWGEINVLADDQLLNEAWSGPEEDEAWKDL